MGVVISFLIPYHLHPLRSYVNDVAIIVSFIVAGAVLARENAFFWHGHAITKLFLSFPLLMLIQYLFFQHQSWADLLLPVAYFFLAALAAVIGTSLSQSRKERDHLALMMASAFFIASLLSVVIQILQVSGLSLAPVVMYMGKTMIFPRPYGNIAQPNQLALILCFGLAGMIFLYRVQRLSNIPSVISAIMLLLGLVMTQSRIGWIIIPAYALLLLRKDEHPKTIPSAILLGYVCLYFFLVFFESHIVGLLGWQGGSVIERIGGARSERAALWQQAWHIASHHPWVGIGWFGFGEEQVRIAANFPSSTYAEHSHNVALNLAAEMGWPFTIILLAFLSWWVYQTCVLSGQSLAVRFASFCLLAVMVHSMVEFPLWYAYILLPVAMLMGMLQQNRWPANGVVLPSVLIISGALMTLVLIVVLSLDYRRVVQAFDVLRSEGAKNQKSLQQPAITIFPQFYDYFKLMGIVPAEGMNDDEIAFIERATYRFGFMHNLNKLAEVCVLNGRHDQAIQVMRTLQRLHPDGYPEYFDYWRAKAELDPRYMNVFKKMLPRNSP